MSATLDAAAFIRYFDGAKAAYVQVRQLPGRRVAAEGAGPCACPELPQPPRASRVRPAVRCLGLGRCPGCSALRCCFPFLPHVPQGRQFPVQVMYTVAPEDSYLDAAIAAALQVLGGAGRGRAGRPHHASEVAPCWPLRAAHAFAQAGPCPPVARG